jgi:hypothetical protein
MASRQVPARRPTGQDTETARLAAQIAADQPNLPRRLRSASTRVCRLAGLLETALNSYRPLEEYLESAVKHVEARTGQPVDDALYEHLTHRFGVADVRLALERLTRAHPDAPHPDDCQPLP